MFSYDEFRSSVKRDGLAVKNRFFINLTMPSLSGESAILFDNAGVNNRNLHLLCKSVNIPGVSVASFDQRETGEVYHAPYDRNFGSATLTFYVDRNFYVRKFFDDWIDTIQNPQDRTLGYYKDFISDNLTVFVMDKEEKINYAIVLWEVHPKSIDGLDLDQGSNDIMTVTVTLDYHYYSTFLFPRSSSKEPREEVLNVRKTTTGTGEPHLPVDEKNTIASAAAKLKNTIGSKFGTIKSAISGYQNDFLSFQRQISEGLGVFNSVASDIRYITNAPRDALNSAKSTMKDVTYGLKNVKNSLKIF